MSSIIHAKTSSDRAAISTRSSTLASRRSIMFGSRRGTTMRSGRSTRSKDPFRVIVGGVDVTPLSLLETNQNKGARKKSTTSSRSSRRGVLRSKGPGSSLASTSSKRRSVSSLTSSSIREGSARAAFDGGVSMVSIASDTSEAVTEDGRFDSDIAASDVEEEDRSSIELLVEAQPAPSAPVIVEYSPPELNQLLEVRLSESPTVLLATMPALFVWANDLDLAAKVEAEADAYGKRLAVRATSSERSAQTSNPPMKAMEVQAQTPSRHQVGSQCSKWDIFNENMTRTTETDPARDTGAHVVQYPRLLRSLTIMEKALIQNELHSKHMLYRDQHSLPIIKQSRPSMGTSSTMMRLSSDRVDPSSDKAEAELEDLWTFSCPPVSGFCVNALDWNRSDPDLLAAGYGPGEFSDQGPGSAGGVVALWTLARPQWPSRLIRSPLSVTSLDFSTAHPPLLAVGRYDGSVVLYDVRQAGDAPALREAYSAQAHRDPVWEVHWTAKDGAPGSETIMSVSTDGAIKQWSMKKGLIAQDLMMLKRIQGPSLLSQPCEGTMNPTGSPLCFDLSRNDTGVYLTATEDGVIHKCSKSYNEQVIESYFGHTGPINRVKISPFMDSAFVTASTDCTVRLWTQKSQQPAITMQAGFDYVFDVDWSPTNASVFASVTRDGRLDAWNLEHSTVSPWVSLTLPNTMLATVRFGVSVPVVLAGTRDGRIHCFRLHGLPPVDPTGPVDQQRHRFETALTSQN